MSGQAITVQGWTAQIEIYVADNSGTPKKMFIPVLLDDITWTSEWSCNPSTMTFTVLKDGVINFGLGSKAVLKLNGKTVWSGYVMYKHRTSDVKIECTAYDQMRYLKNPVSKSLDEITTEDAVKDILEDFEMTLEEIDVIKENKIYKYVADNKEGLEVLEDICAEHANSVSESIIVFDNAGKLALKRLGRMRVTSQFFTAGEMKDWDYTSSIENSYNSIVIDVLQSDGESHVSFVTEEDEDSINRWGLLRFVDKSNEPLTTIKNKAHNLLQILNRESRTLELKDCVGNPEVRGGSLIAVKLNLGDMLLYSWMVVKEITHKFGQSGYTMDITAENQNLGFTEAMSPEGQFTVTKSTTSGSSGGGSTSSGGTGTYEERMWNMLRADGFSAAAAAGVLANSWAESGVEPTKHQIGGNAYGLFQWDDRKQKLISWCQSNGKDYTSFEGQMDYFFYEFYGGDSTWIGYVAYYGGTDGFKNLADWSTATKAFLYGFERPGVPRLQERLNKAQEYYNKWKNYTTIPVTNNSAGSGGGDGMYTGSMTWPLANGAGGVSSGYGWRTYWNGYRYVSEFHMGTDIACPDGTPVVAADGGTVIAAGDGVEHWSYGVSVLIKHSDSLYTRYAHLQRGSLLVSVGSKVSKGQQIARSNSTGNITGPHLHFEVRTRPDMQSDSCLNPNDYIHR